MIATVLRKLLWMKHEFFLQVIKSGTCKTITYDDDLNPPENLLFIFHSAKVSS